MQYKKDKAILFKELGKVVTVDTSLHKEISNHHSSGIVESSRF
jgi:hypothetical protein